MAKSDKKKYTGQYGFAKLRFKIELSPDYRELLTQDTKVIKKLDTKILSAAVDFLSRQANRRLTDIENRAKKSNIDYTKTPAYKYVMVGSKKHQAEGRFTMTGNKSSKNRAELIHEYRRLVNFFEAETSSVKKIDRVKANLYKRLGVQSLTQTQEDLLWEIYLRLESDEELKEFDSGQVQKDLARLVLDPENIALTVDDFADLYKESLVEDYEKKEAESKKMEENGFGFRGRRV